MDTVDLDQIRNDVLDYLAQLGDDNAAYGAFRQRLDQQPSFWGTIECGLILHTLNVINYVPPEYRVDMANHIQRYQREDGSYEQSLHPPSYASACARMVSRLLVGPTTRERWDEPASWEQLEPFLVGMDWSDPPRVATELWGRLALAAADPRTPAAVLHELFVWLDAYQNPRTGWWPEGTRVEHKPDHLLTTWAIGSIYAMHEKTIPRAETLAVAATKLQSRIGPAKGLFGSLDRPHWSEMCAAYVMFFVKDDVDGSTLRDLGQSSIRLLTSTVEFFQQGGADAHAADTTFGLLARLQTLVVLSKLLPKHFRGNRPWKLLWHDRNLLM